MKKRSLKVVLMLAATAAIMLPAQPAHAQTCAVADPDLEPIVCLVVGTVQRAGCTPKLQLTCG